MVRAKNAHTEISEGMTFKKTEKEIIKAIVKYGGEVKSLVDVLNESQILEKRGIAIVPCGQPSYIFLRKEKFNESDMEKKEGMAYVVELVSLIQLLINNRLIVIIPYEDSPSPIIGKLKATKKAPGLISIDDEKEFITLGDRNVSWCDKDRNQIAWTNICSEDIMPMAKTLTYWFSVSQELKDLVENDFKTEEEIRFSKQQKLTWVSIGVSLLIGLLGYFI